MKVDFVASISNRQIVLRSTPYDEQKESWGEGNLAQGLIWHDNYLVFDPIADGAFDSICIVEIVESLDIDKYAQRAIELPFSFTTSLNTVISTVSEQYYLTAIPQSNEEAEKAKRFGNYFLFTEKSFFAEGSYRLLFQICVGIVEGKTLAEEVYYRFSFMPVDDLSEEVTVRLDDEFGLNKNSKIIKGMV